MNFTIRAFGEEGYRVRAGPNSARGLGHHGGDLPDLPRTPIPGECLVGEVDGQRAALITAMRYARSAWIGNLIVSPEYRRRGLGLSMMEHVIQRVETSGITTLRLEADPLGVGIYRRLGFVDQFESARFRKRPSARDQLGRHYYFARGRLERHK